GLAERRPQPEDRRTRQIFLTDDGQKALARVRVLAAELQREFFGALTAQERKTLHALLKKLAGSTMPAQTPPS
ncbi:MAG TPA: MarR family transcriptional regulator, partial [Solirubrobacteraceae bacterium]|nr:MarR family transcriptional regulator [Solirubrobacteraceae bacterium]